MSKNETPEGINRKHISNIETREQEAVASLISLAEDLRKGKNKEN